GGACREEGRAARRHRRDRRERRAAGAAQCHPGGHRHRPAATADRSRPPVGEEEGMSRGRKWTIGVLLVIALIVVAGVAWIALGPGPMDFAGGQKVALSDYRGGDPTGVPAGLAPTDPVKRGEYLARAADCLVCHTAPGGKDYAGGFAFQLPFGTLYSTNITPDKETGIGNYSDQEFLAALRRGVRRDGRRLYPAMPY